MEIWGYEENQYTHTKKADKASEDHATEASILYPHVDLDTVLLKLLNNRFIKNDHQLQMF